MSEEKSIAEEKYSGRYSDNKETDEIVCALMDGTDHLSFSSMCAFIDSPRKFIEYKLGKKEQTDAMDYGSMLHCLVLEPDDFDNRFHPLDDSDIIEKIGGAKPRSTSKYKEWVLLEQEKAQGKKMVKPDDYAVAKMVAREIRFNRVSRLILSKAPVREQSVEWTYMDFKFKGFIDINGEPWMADLKSMTDASHKKAQREITGNLNFLQAAMYRIGEGTQNQNKDNYIIACDKTAGVSVHQIHKRFMDYGFEMYEEVMKKFQHCILKDLWRENYNFWSDRFDGLFICDKPAWI